MGPIGAVYREGSIGTGVRGCIGRGRGFGCHSEILSVVGRLSIVHTLALLHPVMEILGDGVTPRCNRGRRSRAIRGGTIGRVPRSTGEYRVFEQRGTSSRGGRGSPHANDGKQLVVDDEAIDLLMAGMKDLHQGEQLGK